MTQAYNLAILANAVNTSGQLNVGTNATGTLPVANGGTGQSALTANNVVLGNGTSGVQFVAPGTSGNVLTSNGTTWTSASATGYSGVRVQLFLSSGTFTVPAGITAVKVSASGGGGGGGGGGANGSAGGSTSFGSSVIAGGGSGGGRGFDNGTECVQNGPTPGGSSTNIPYNYSNFSYNSTRGSGGGGGGQQGCSAGGGGTGSQGVGYVTGLTPGSNITVTIGAGGSGGGGGTSGSTGQAGVLAVEW